MSNNEEKVQINKDNGHKLQWAKGLFYRKDGVKDVLKSEKAKGAVIVIFIFTTIFLLFQDDPSAIERDTSIKGPNQINSYTPPIDLESYVETKEAKKISKKKHRKIEKLSVISSKSKVEIPLGSMAKAVLVTGATNGPVKAKLIEDLESHGEIFLPEGTVLWGKGSSTDERLIVTFTKFVTEEGKSKDILANAFDASDQILGLKGSIIGRTSKKIIAGAGIGVAGALKTMQQAENLGGIAIVKPTLENALLNGASSAALSIAEQELEDLKNKQTIIEVKKDTEILVVFGKG